MSFFRKVLILKQIEKGFSSCEKSVSGIVTIETECGVNTLFLSLTNFKTISNGEYHFAICDNDGKFYSFPLPSRPTSLQKTLDTPLNFNGKVQVGVYFLLDELPLLIAFGSDVNSAVSYSPFCKKIAEKCVQIKKETERNQEIISSIYNDEAVATENYFELDRDINEKIKLLGQNDNETISNEDVLSSYCKQEQTQEKHSTSNGFENETNACDCKKYSQSNPYYDYAKRELDEIFSKFEEEKDLKRLFVDSKWAKINYSSDKYYVVGVINKNSKPKYICYGVPDVYRVSAPPELDGYCSFLPLSVFDVKGKGYWMMYQDAITGKRIDKYKP